MSKTNPSVKSHSTYYKNIQALHILTDLARPKLLTNPKYDQIRSKRIGKGCIRTFYFIVLLVFPEFSTDKVFFYLRNGNILYAQTFHLVLAHIFVSKSRDILVLAKYDEIRSATNLLVNLL